MSPADSPPRGPSRKRAATITLAIVGALVCAYLEVLHVQTYLGLGGTGYCDAGEAVSCTDVALSPASVVLGVPLPILGFAGFLAIALAAGYRSKLLVWLAGFAALSSVGLLIYEIVEVGAICMWCEVVHLICFGLLALAWLDRANGEPKHDARTAAFVFVPPATLVLATALFAPGYWLTASWSSGIRLPHGFDENGRPWLGSEDPDLVLHEYVDYTCPHCRIASARMKMRLAQDNDLRIVRHHQPRMRCVLPDRPATQRCTHARAAICAGDQAKFWEMDDWLFHHPASPISLDLEQASSDIGLDLEALQACMDAPETYARAQADVDDAHDHGIRGTPGYVVDGERLEPDQLQQLMNDR
jgi:uncharacterized membrane protein